MSRKELTVQLEHIIEGYSDEIQEGIEAAALKAAKTGAKMLRDVSPERTGQYARSWRYKKDKVRIGKSGYTIYNTRGQLTHLLENGHAIWNKPGARTRAFRHIAPVREYVEKMFQADVEEVLRG